MPESTLENPAAAVARLEARVQDLERERRQLVALVEILQEISGTLNFVDLLQTITHKLGEALGLDRCSIFLAERGSRTARLVASFEDPSIRNYVVDLDRYPEIKRALQSGEPVFIPDAQSDPLLAHIRGPLASRKVRTITVVPITWRRVAIGAIFLRTFRDGPSFSEDDVAFAQAVGPPAPQGAPGGRPPRGQEPLGGRRVARAVPHPPPHPPVEGRACRNARGPTYTTQEPPTTRDRWARTPGSVPAGGGAGVWL